MRNKSTINLLGGVKKPFQITFGLFGVLFLALAGLSLVGSNNSRAETEGEGLKVISIYDDGARVAFRTNATTVRTALKERGVILNSGDNVEPSLDEELTGNDYSVNIYRARPILVEDGANRERIMSASQTPQKMVSDAGFEIFDEDIIYNNPSENPAADGVATHLKIKRAKVITVDMFGKATVFRTQAETIKGFLAEKDISLKENDEVSISLNTAIADGLSFNIWRNGKQTITVEEEIDFEIEKIQDADKEVGYREVKEAGKKGIKVVSYEVEMQSGAEISRTKISEAETKKPKKQVEVVGTKTVAMPYTGGGNKTEWLQASGIPESEWGYVDFIVGRESGWNPCAYNPGRSDCSANPTSACGLAQSYPCGKQSVYGHWTDPVANLKWQYNYVKGKYGGYEGAYNFWKENHWY